MSTEAAVLSPVYNPQMQAFINGDEPINGVTYTALVEKHGADNVNNALFNLFQEVHVEDIKQQYAGSPIEDDAIEYLDKQLAASRQPTTLEAQDDINDAYRDLMRFYAEQRLEELDEDLKAGPGEQKKSKELGGDGSGNWLVVLAKAMGAAAGEHLKQAVLSGYNIAEISGRTDQDTNTQAGRDFNAQKAKDMAIEQASMQAHTQMFKMAFEATATLIKTTGEGMSAMARKQ